MTDGNMLPGDARVDITTKLPCCGLMVKYSNRRERDEGDKRDDVIKFIAWSGQALSYWFESRMARHHCDRVSEANPWGLEPTDYEKRMVEKAMLEE